MSYAIGECLGGVSVEDRFLILGDLGGGAYGTVFKARDNANGGKVVALKRITVQEDPDVPGCPSFIMREVANLNRLSSAPEKHIVRYMRDTYKYLVNEVSSNHPFTNV